MKPAPFRYLRPASLAEALSELDHCSAQARVLAGGQSLVPMLNFRLCEPEVVIDLAGLDALSGIERRGNQLRIGALATYSEVLHSPDVAAVSPLLIAAINQIGHPAIRHRGTIGGSLAHADPAAELPACMLVLQARFQVASSTGRRTIAAEDFFIDLFETALAPNELLIAIEIEQPSAETRSGFLEFARRHGDFALAGLAAQSRVSGTRLEDLRLAFFALENKPVRVMNTESVLSGREFDPARLDDVRVALAQELRPNGDIHASAAYKKQLAFVLLKRVLTTMIERSVDDA